MDKALLGPWDAQAQTTACCRDTHDSLQGFSGFWVQSWIGYFLNGLCACARVRQASGILGNACGSLSSILAIKVWLMEKVDSEKRKKKVLGTQGSWGVSTALSPSWPRLLEFVTCHLGVKQSTSNPRDLDHIEESGNRAWQDEGREVCGTAGAECESIQTTCQALRRLTPPNTRAC